MTSEVLLSDGEGGCGSWESGLPSPGLHNLRTKATISTQLGARDGASKEDKYPSYPSPFPHESYLSAKAHQTLWEDSS